MSTRPRPPLRALLVTGIAAVVAGGGVAALLIAQTGNHTIGGGPYQPFRAGFAVNLAAQIKRAPIFFPDPKRGDRAFFLDQVDGRFVALHVVVPDKPGCVVSYERDRHRYVDCDRRPIDPRALAQFTVAIAGRGENRVVEVDLRSVLRPAVVVTTQTGP